MVGIPETLLLLLNGEDSYTGFGVTTTAPNQTLTINSLGVSASTTVDWGDGNTDDYTGTAQRTHQYASAGTYTVKILQPENVTRFDIRDSKVTLNSANLSAMVNIDAFIATGISSGTFNSSDVSSWSPSVFYLYSMPSGYSGTFNSSDVSSWSPTDFYLYSMPSGYSGTFDSSDVSSWSPSVFYLLSMPTGYSGTFNSSDVSSWSPTRFYLYAMPAGYSGTFNSSDVSSWSPTFFYLFDMPSGYGGTFDSADVSSWSPARFYLYSMPGSYSFTITDDASFSGWTTTTDFQMQGNNLTQAQVDTILYSLYSMTTSRTASNGTINVSGSNAAPSGTFQAASGAVDTNTDGKEVAHELLNDGQAVGFNTWATVTFTA